MPNGGCAEALGGLSHSHRETVVMAKSQVYRLMLFNMLSRGQYTP